jgi:hypothetical protein
MFVANLFEKQYLMKGAMDDCGSVAMQKYEKLN